MSSGDRRPSDTAESTDGSTDAEGVSTSEVDRTPPAGTRPGETESQSTPSTTEESTGASKPPRATPRSGNDESLWTRFRSADDGPLLFIREFMLSASIVLVIGLLLFGLSGVWPPMVAIESESMEPNINQYDLVFVTEPGRFAPSEADRLGVVTAESTTEYESFNRDGSVIVFEKPGSVGPPIIHRAHLFVTEGENWYDRADPQYINADNCEELKNCPAPYAGYITKGDNQTTNGQYDQTNGIAPIVKPTWVDAVAQVRVPYLGWIRLALTGAASVTPHSPAGIAAIVGGAAFAVGRRPRR